ncbi:diacylglycerol kinase family protein [Prochlorococcus marinus]|uniref:diacylglycerol kinase family protein n=1 Tax=Prochlorococcus marinus TaxID=1219 RepID=UPI0007B38229|nr:diacylglycerol kinase family protein [Prochlorococcus marinus]KZR73579.1 Undecaprenol kinase [Prochlorococcus marinus str. MIT 1320]
MLPQTNNLLSEEITPLSSQGHQAARRGAWRIAADLPSSFRYAAQGLAYGIVSQRNFRIHVVIGAVVFGLGLWLQLNLNDLAVLVLTVAAVLVLELLNTSIEAVVDLAIGRRFHPLARIAKDTAAAAVMVAAISSLLIALLLLLPPLLIRLRL